MIGIPNRQCRRKRRAWTGHTNTQRPRKRIWISLSFTSRLFLLCSLRFIRSASFGLRSLLLAVSLTGPVHATLFACFLGPRITSPAITVRKTPTAQEGLPSRSFSQEVLRPWLPCYVILCCCCCCCCHCTGRLQSHQTIPFARETSINLYPGEGPPRPPWR